MIVVHSNTNGVEGPRLDGVEEEHECAEIQESQREFMVHDDEEHASTAYCDPGKAGRSMAA